MGDRLPDDVLVPMRPAPARAMLCEVLARMLAPRVYLKVSDFSDQHRKLSTKSSAEPGDWHTDRNELLREPMDCFTPGSSVREVTLMFPIQLGKTEVALNVLGSKMVQRPGPIMVALPGEVSLNKWVAQKLGPMLDESPEIKETLTSVSSRETANRRDFKDFAGGQLYLEHAGSTSRLKSTSAELLIVDELDEFAANLTTGDDPGEMLDGRTSAFPETYQRLYISSPQIEGQSRIKAKFLAGDQRHRYLPCPHCGHEQFLQWSGLRWDRDRHPDHGRRAWYVCQECACEIDEHHKTWMLGNGRWVPHSPGAPRSRRSYTTNCLYYPIGLGPRWADLVEIWLDAQGDPAKLKVFLNDRLAETWEDESTRRVKHEALAEKAEHYKLRTAPMGVLAATAGVDTQDDRLAVQIVGWGRRMAWWAIDYVELQGDPAEDDVWHALTTLLRTPIQHESGATLHIESFAQDAAGHKTEDVKAFVRSARSRGLRRPLCIFGAVPNNAPVLAKGRLADVNWRGQFDKHGIQIYYVGTVAAKKWLFGRLSLDAKRDEEHLQALQTEESAARSQGRATNPVPPVVRECHFSEDLPEAYFLGLTSEVYDPRKNRYVPKKGATRRNEPLDTWVYAYAAAHHPELRLHRATETEWALREARINAFRKAAASAVDVIEKVRTPATPAAAVTETTAVVPDAEPAASTDPDEGITLSALLRARSRTRHGR